MIMKWFCQASIALSHVQGVPSVSKKIWVGKLFDNFGFYCKPSLFCYDIRKMRKMLLKVFPNRWDTLYMADYGILLEDSKIWKINLGKQWRENSRCNLTYPGREGRGVGRHQLGLHVVLEAQQGHQERELVLGQNFDQHGFVLFRFR